MNLNFLATDPPQVGFLSQNLSWILAGVIVVVGLLVIGLRDLLRFSPRRIWAISGVSFDESIRRRVLWIVPLAFLGIVAVAQFQKAVDAQDAIRQTTKICLFATGVVVIVTTVILACTSLPKEIESKVIFTIVTKPTTRLEIVLGKVVGFARVSGLILLIMGLFTFGYLKLREAWAVSVIKGQLASEVNDPASRPLLLYYSQAGLLGTKSMELPDVVQVLGRPAAGGFNEATRVIGGQSMYWTVAFDLTDEQKAKILQGIQAGGLLHFANRFGFESRDPTEEEAKQISEMKLPTAAPLVGPKSPLFPALQNLRPMPQVMAQVVNAQGLRLVDPKQIGSIYYLKQQEDLARLDASAQRRAATESPNVTLEPDGSARTYLAPAAVQGLLDAGKFYVMVFAATPAVDYLVGPRPTALVLTDLTGRPVLSVDASARPAPPANAAVVGTFLQRPPGNDPAAPAFLSSQGRYGQQLLGRDDGTGAVAAYHFDSTEAPQAQDGRATIEIRTGVEGSAMDYAPDDESVLRMTLQVRNAKTGALSELIPFVPENNRTSYVQVPAALVADGAFDVYLRALTNQQWFGLQPSSVTLVTADRSFAVNLFKSLLTLWLMAILVISIGVFASTFLSWPIAIVLTVVMLFGHWGVQQIGDSAGAGLGAEVTQSLGLQDPTGAKIVRTSVNALGSALTVTSAFLPDVSKFAVTEDIERGVSIPPAKLLQACGVLLSYALPMTVLSYVFLKRKEVAP